MSKHGPVTRLFTRLRVDSRILLIFLALALASFVFLKLASEILEGETMALDRQILLALRNPADLALPIGPRWLRETMINVTALGSTALLAIITVIVAGYLVALRKAQTALYLVIAIAAGASCGMLLKQAFLRPRPDLVPHLVEVQNASFPSGHAMNSAIVFLTLGALLARSEAKPAVRIYIMCVVTILTLAVGITRVYLGVHWPSDVLAGWCVGSVWAVSSSLIARAIGHSRQTQKTN